MTGVRIACVYAPELALQGVLRRDPEQREAPLVLAAHADDTPKERARVSERARVLACTKAAAQAGVRRGMTVAQARTVASGALGGAKLRVLPESSADTAAAAAALADVGFTFAPRIETNGGVISFDVGDLRALYPLGEQALAQAMAAHAARLGLYVRVGIAANKAVALTAAHARPIAIVPTGGERSFLAPLALGLGLGALESLPGTEGPALLALLERWGIGTLGALAALPAADVALRLGPLGTRLHRLACGRDDAPFAPRLPADALEEGTELEYPIETLEPLAFVLRGLLDRALARLGSRGLGCAELTLRLSLDPKGYDVRDLPLAAPTREATTLLQHLRLDLARRPPGAAVVGATIEIRPATVRAAQLDLWRPAGPAPEKLAATLARLAAQVGSENVGVPTVVSSFREEAIELRPFELRPFELRPFEVRGPAESAAVAPLVSLGFRRFRPPAEVEVLVDRDGPAALRGHQVSSRVLVAAGPYRVEGEWWGEGLARDYWDVHADDGAVYRLHHDRQAGRWYLDGYYD